MTALIRKPVPLPLPCNALSRPITPEIWQKFVNINSLDKAPPAKSPVLKGDPDYDPLGGRKKMTVTQKTGKPRYLVKGVQQKGKGEKAKKEPPSIIMCFRVCQYDTGVWLLASTRYILRTYL